MLQGVSRLRYDWPGPRRGWNDAQRLSLRIGAEPGGAVKNNLYAAAWTIIQNCCEAAVTAELFGEPLIADLANAAAMLAAERIGIPERELQRVRQLMADERRSRTSVPTGIDAQYDRLRRSAANANGPWSSDLPPHHSRSSPETVDHPAKPRRIEP
jgi:hypothetical protein